MERIMSEAEVCPRCGSALEPGARQCARCAAAATRVTPPTGSRADERTIGVASRPGPALPGRRVFGDYELEDEIARGGMGVVYRARQTSLNRTVALKMILSGRVAGEADIERFRTEAESAAGLRHANIVAIHEVGAQDGQHYFSMDYIEGSSLADEIRGGPLAAPRAARLASLIARAIHYAHGRGILHRDLKPSNVLLDEHDQPHVTDFGLAKQMGAPSEMTATGQVLGTPSYMPPEQAAGRHDAVGPASDVYSIGALLYEMLVGRPPFQADSPLDTILQVLDHEPPPPRLLNPKLARDLDTVALKCLEKEPARRYETAGQLADDLDRFMAGDPIRARPIGVVEQWVRRSRAHARTIRAASLAVTAVVALFLCLAMGRNLYLQFLQGTVHFHSDGATLRAELSSNHGSTVRTFSIPTVESLQLREGEYRLDYAAPGQFRATSLLSVARGEEQRFQVGLAQQRLWKPIVMAELLQIETSKLQHYDDVILLERRFNTATLRRIDGLSARSHWSVTIYRESPPAGIQSEKEKSVWRAVDWANARPAGQPALMAPPADLDGDGSNDLVWLWPGHDESPVLAQSGADGSVLWFRCHGIAALDAMPAVTDLDGDGETEMAVVLRDPAGYRLEVLQSRTGQRLWHVEIPVAGAPHKPRPMRRSPACPYRTSRRSSSPPPAGSHSSSSPGTVSCASARRPGRSTAT